MTLVSLIEKKKKKLFKLTSLFVVVIITQIIVFTFNTFNLNYNLGYEIKLPQSNFLFISLEAQRASEQNMRSSFEVESEGEKHFHFFPQTLGVSTHLNTIVENSVNTSDHFFLRIGEELSAATFVKNMTNLKCMKRIICEIPEGTLRTFAHFAARLFPCWSALQIFPQKERHIQFRFEPPGEWNAELLLAIEKSGIQTTRLDQNRSMKTSDCDWNIKFIENPPFFRGPALQKVDMNGTSDTFMFEANHDSHKWKANPPHYFANQRDVAYLQRIILGPKYIEGVSKEKIIQVLLLNRARSRHIVHGKEIVNGLQNSVLGHLINVTYVPDMKGSLFDQALIMHTADIIISPHGAQLTNLPFIKPCTVTAEIFPKGYFLVFYEHYVLAAGGFAFAGYEEGRNPHLDNFGLGEYKNRVERRGKHIHISAASMIRQFPDFILKFNTCRMSHILS